MGQEPKSDREIHFLTTNDEINGSIINSNERRRSILFFCMRNPNRQSACADYVHWKPTDTLRESNNNWLQMNNAHDSDEVKNEY